MQSQIPQAHVIYSSCNTVWCSPLLMSASIKTCHCKAQLKGPYSEQSHFHPTQQLSMKTQSWCNDGRHTRAYNCEAKQHTESVSLTTIFHFLRYIHTRFTTVSNYQHVSKVDLHHMTRVFCWNCIALLLPFISVSLYWRGHFVYASTHQICINLWAFF